MKKTFKTWAVETAIKLWGTLSFAGIFLIEGQDGSCELMPFALPSIISFTVFGLVYDALEKKGYFKKEVRK